MPGDLPEYFFRIRENGAVVFRVDTENRQRRIEFVELAMVNLKNGVIKPHGDETLSDTDLAEIRAWIARRTDLVAARDVDDILRAVDQIGRASCRERV